MTTFTPPRLGQIIKAYRLEQKLTQAQLAAKSGTGLRFIVELERGKPTVQLGKVIAVADALGLMLMLQKDASLAAAKPKETARLPGGLAEHASHYATGLPANTERLLSEFAGRIRDRQSEDLREYVEMKVRDAKLKIMPKK
jgi:HTH-type transcriptional regulator / antitoxin HipB